jgi:hypothetical protein
MSNSKRGLDDFISIVESSNTKTASAKTETFNSSLIEKLASELSKSAEGALPQANAVPANSSVAGAAPAVVGTTDAVTAAQLVLAGANPAEPAKGEMNAPTKPNEGVIITDAAGKVTDANAVSKEPAAVVAAAEPTNKEGSVEKTAELKRAEEIGATMARSYVKELEKIAFDRQYSEALEYLQSRGVLEGYDIKNS